MLIDEACVTCLLEKALHQLIFDSLESDLTNDSLKQIGISSHHSENYKAYFIDELKPFWKTRTISFVKKNLFDVITGIAD